jgi:hypothetical protein
METLTLEHLSVYLPYGLMGKLTHHPKSNYVTMAAYLSNLQRKWTINMFAENGVLPILYPLSSLAETIWFEGKEINPIEFIKDWYNEKYATEIDDLEHYSFKNDFILFGVIQPKMETELEIINMPYQAYQLLFKMKIDIFGLIEKGLAVDVNTLETNPYKL